MGLFFFLLNFFTSFEVCDVSLVQVMYKMWVDDSEGLGEGDLFWENGVVEGQTCE